MKTASMPQAGRRAGAAMAALCLQALLFLFLLFAAGQRPPLPRAGREMLLRLLPLPRRETPQVIDARGVPRRAARPAASPPAIMPPSAAPAPAAPAFSSGGLSAFPGAPPALSPRRNENPLASPYQPMDRERRDAEMEQKNTPPRISCTGTTADSPAASAVYVDLICVAKKLMGIEAPAAAPAAHASDADVRAAIAAANKRRGGGTPSALASVKQAGDGNGEETVSGGPAADAGPARPGR